MGAPHWDGTTDDLIDTRDLIEYREYWTPVTDEDDEEKEILEAIDRLESQGISDWEHGETLIKDSYFKEYAQEFASDIGAIPDTENNWPLYCIDWEWAARELRMDYWVRS